MIIRNGLFLCLCWLSTDAFAQNPKLHAWITKHCLECHDPKSQQGDLDLTQLLNKDASADDLSIWIKVHDRIVRLEMPPSDSTQPSEPERTEYLQSSKDLIIALEKLGREQEPRTGMRRLTRSEYENTVRDLFQLPGIALQGDLPTDGSAHGFDKNSDALDISHVNLAKYMEVADRTLTMAIATRPHPPTFHKQRISLASQYIVRLVMGNGDCVLLKDKQPDPSYPVPGKYNHIDLGAHERMEVFNEECSVGFFRHEDESFNPYFLQFSALYPGRYRIRASFWSFGWDKGKVVTARGTEAARLTAVQLGNDGRGGGHPSYVLGYFDAPPNQEKVHEFETWLNFKETIGFNAASLALVHIYHQQGRAMAFTGPGIASDWLDIEGPIHDVWPPPSHRMLFGDLPLVEFPSKEQAHGRPPKRKPVRQEILAAINRPDVETGIWSVASAQPLLDADRLLESFLPKAFRRPVQQSVRAEYVALVRKRLDAGDCFESAMRFAFQSALCAPDFLYHLETDDPTGTRIDDYSLANRLSYFLWNSKPDDRLVQLAASQQLHHRETRIAEMERMLKDKKSDRFIVDFLGQWLKLRQIGANDPDRILYPEFSGYLQDSMVAESHAYFRELLNQDLGAKYLVQSDFAMLNEKLAMHYGIAGVSGSQIRRVSLPEGSPRGGFLTQASILKVTANGTTTSPVPRGAFVMDRFLGQPPEPPPANVAAVEPDVRGSTTIREQLEKHRNHQACSACHAKIDPPGFALESFDVIGGSRGRYRSIGSGDAPLQGNIDPGIPLFFKLGPPVDSSGSLHDGRQFQDIVGFQALIASEPDRLTRNLLERLATYSLGRKLRFSDRDAIDQIMQKTNQAGGGIRTLLRELICSELFQSR